MIQRRMDGTTNFYRNWQHYEDGFGNLRREFWLGKCNKMNSIYNTTLSEQLQNPIRKSQKQRQSQYPYMYTWLLDFLAGNRYLNKVAGLN